jgi:hypothetical protein
MSTIGRSKPTNWTLNASPNRSRLRAMKASGRKLQAKV